MITATVIEQVDETLDEFINTYATVKNDDVNKMPFEGSWTPGQLAEHIIMSLSGFADLLNGPDKETERDPHQHSEMIKTMFLNFDIKMQSPPSVVPPVKHYEKEQQLGILQHVKNKIDRTLPGLDMDKTCTAADIPQIGYITRHEIISFVLYHTQRHIHQLKNIILKLKY